jgi:hypothetical protein
MTSTSNLAPHELLPVAIMRCLAVVEDLGRSKSANSALTMQKAAIFDSALKNPRIARRIVAELAPDRLPELDFHPVLYPAGEEHGDPINKREITKIATLLSNAKLVELKPLDGALIIKPSIPEPLLEIENIPQRWQITLKALKGLSSKSATTLQNAALRESSHDAEQHIFIARTPDIEGGNKGL